MKRASAIVAAARTSSSPSRADPAFVNEMGRVQQSLFDGFDPRRSGQEARMTRAAESTNARAPERWIRSSRRLATPRSGGASGVGPRGSTTSPWESAYTLRELPPPTHVLLPAPRESVIDASSSPILVKTPSERGRCGFASAPLAPHVTVLVQARARWRPKSSRAAVNPVMRRLGVEQP
jgi:hypothetical protein